MLVFSGISVVAQVTEHALAMRQRWALNLGLTIFARKESP